jgi:NADH-quinone oxidoreductase subunit L
MYHLTTHAFFKALLFLGAGCVIHTLHTNDIRQMGGLLKQMPVTGLTFLLAGLALAGVWPLSGFFSKDEILTLAFSHNRFLWVMGTLTAGLTAFYMARLFTVAFLGKSRSHHPAHEAPPVMTIPLLALAVPSAIAGFLGIPNFLHTTHETHLPFNPMVAIVSTVVALSGLALGVAAYRDAIKGTVHPEAHLAPGGLSPYFVLGWLRTLLVRKYFVDEIYGWINQNIQQRTAVILSLFERYVIIGLWANGIAKTTGFTGSIVRLAQTGKVQGYALAFLAGLALIIYLVLP